MPRPQGHRSGVRASRALLPAPSSREPFCHLAWRLVESGTLHSYRQGTLPSTKGYGQHLLSAGGSPASGQTVLSGKCLSWPSSQRGPQILQTAHSTPQGLAVRGEAVCSHSPWVHFSCGFRKGRLMVILKMYSVGLGGSLPLS